ncbi:DUF2813 domain-containing protein [Acinetobacter baumannii]|uniref:DUF2813 domain-containing protein n=1 Tax=Acinetobacter baumannii TaxID=470 RepID=UPI00244CBF8A|nr:DUF2813 domain-containing protein [Acinetobacter baumannii]MDH2514290.1 DUF2813 domain-containing protein [Acinetobacter baumannii]
MNFYINEDFRTNILSLSDENEYCVLNWDDWNDFGYRTQFHLKYINNKVVKEIGTIKIAFEDDEVKFFNKLVPKKFNRLEQKFFSIGGSGGYYKSLKKLSKKTRNKILNSVNDLVLNIDRFNELHSKKVDVLQTSLMREFFADEIRGKYNRLANGKPELTAFSLSFEYHSDNNRKTNVSFEVNPNSLPPTNLHVVIGSNGVGKTNFLNKILKQYFAQEIDLTKVIYFSYSPFDKPFHGIVEQDISDYDYAFHGLLKSPFNNMDNTLNTGTELENQFIEAYNDCMKSISKTDRWFEMLNILIKDDIYLTDIFSDLIDNVSEAKDYDISSIYKKLSTGHKIIIKSLTHLVNSVTEKSLILYDEPETYLHPPLISAYLRAISWLLIDRNAIGILTTHSPIILQEVPKSCVWKIIRRGDVFNALRLENETFGENISLLNHEVFNLTASNSSFIDLLEYEAKKYIKENKNSDNIKIFKKVLSNFNNEIGSEARAHLMKIIKNIKMDVENEKN